MVLLVLFGWARFSLVAAVKLMPDEDQATSTSACNFHRGVDATHKRGRETGGEVLANIREFNTRHLLSGSICSARAHQLQRFLLRHVETLGRSARAGRNSIRK